MSHDHTSPMRLRTPGDLLAAVPYLLGFHPTDSLVIVGLTGNKITVAGRADLPQRAQMTAWVDGAAAQHLSMLRGVGATAAVVAGYGPAAAVTPVIDALTPRLHAAGISILDTLRVTDGRYHSYQCHDPACCPADGVPFDAVSSATAVHAIVAGHSALPDRAALVASLAPISGPARDAVTAATRRARERRLTAYTAGGRAAVIREGKKAVREAFARYATEQVLTDDEVAWLSVLLTDVAVRDAAWQATHSEASHLALWTDLTRRVEPDLAAAPASLLAFTAWHAGLGALASVALDRAQAAESTYPLAHLIDRLLREGIPPAALDGWPAVDGPRP
ncbi:DUF4192 domain-containing protein [Micromonospora sp. 4G57]|uniref:DUF4192 domain-containing protein n=1 Tax=Micromonospora sicca TaxID=2202420 RepID=A0ABU5JNQ5_9ACTN|nr:MULTISPECIES: DUF4192 domain-containing protein [unclassified Micromonospora]MDZ5447258.1 DUF4192 domain-containing protein [Micromonospora sp. 4G57]MDZ5493954.1 DUF4192 domain-containing protein [Micromonospora sp. 4G53]